MRDSLIKFAGSVGVRGMRMYLEDGRAKGDVGFHIELDNEKSMDFFHIIMDIKHHYKHWKYSCLWNVHIEAFDKNNNTMVIFLRPEDRDNMTEDRRDALMDDLAEVLENKHRNYILSKSSYDVWKKRPPSFLFPSLGESDI